MNTAFVASIPLTRHSSLSLSPFFSFRPTIPHPRPIRTIFHTHPHLPNPPLFLPPKAQQALQTGYAHSASSDTETALKEAIESALSTVPTPVVALITAPITRDASQLYQVADDLLNGVAIHGATTCAAPLTNDGFLPNGVSVLILGGAGVVAAGARGTDGYVVGREAADLLAERMGGKEKVEHVILQATPGIEEGVLEGIESVLGEEVDVFGGSAADNEVKGEWKLLSSDGGVLESGVALVGIGKGVGYGACLCVPYVEGALGGVVTKAKGRTVYEIEGKKASEMLGEWVGRSIEKQVKEGGGVIVECANVPLGVQRGGAWLAVHAAQIGEDGSVGLFAEVREGERLVVMRKMGEGDSIKAARMGLEMAYEEARKKGGLEKPTAGVMVYCGGLSIAVGEGLNESLEGLKGKVPLLGMTVFGEQGNVGEKNSHSNLAVGVALFE